MTMHSSITFLFATFAVTSNFVAIFTNGQSLADKWAVPEPLYDFNKATNTFTMTFDVDDSIVQANTDATIWYQDCKDGGNQLLAADGMENIVTAVDTIGKATLTFDMNVDILRQNSDLFTQRIAQNTADIKYCVRFMLQNDDGSLEINFLEIITTVHFILTATFDLIMDDVTMKMKDPVGGEAAFDKAFGLKGYLCDPAHPEIAIAERMFNQGSVISVCVTPDDDALAEGLLLQSIDEFQWVRGMITQPAVVNMLQASNSLTSLTCAPDSLYCSFYSMLWSDFYTPPTPDPSSSPSSAPSSFPTSAGSTAGTICQGVNSTSATTMDFYESTVVSSDLQTGGELRYTDIGMIGNEAVDLVITSSDYTNARNNQNGKDPTGTFGSITVRTIQGDVESGKGNFELCFVQEGTLVPVMAESFQWSVFDLDNRGSNPNVKEKMSIDTSQVSGYSLYPNPYDTEVVTYCENDGSWPPCDEGVRTVFEGSTVGGGGDNPTDPNSMTEQQMKRSAVFTFTNTSCWTMEFNAYCDTEPIPCGHYGGSKLLFAGSASQVVFQGTTDCTDNGADSASSRRLDITDDTGWDATTGTALIGGYGRGTLKFPGSRRLETDGRALQGYQPRSSEIDLAVTIVTRNEDMYRLKTSGGSSMSTWCGCLLLILGGIVGTILQLL